MRDTGYSENGEKAAFLIKTCKGRFIVTMNVGEVLRKPIRDSLVVKGLVGSLGEGYGHDKSAPTGFVCDVAFAPLNISKRKQLLAGATLWDRPYVGMRPYEGSGTILFTIYKFACSSVIE